MTFSAALWLEHVRVAIQSAWFGAFAVALWASLQALATAQRALWLHLARRAWVFAMAMFVAMWLLGAGVEMMRRTATVSGGQMIVALGAFALLMAGVLSLAREWFGASLDVPLRSGKIALSLLILTFAGWWFGELAMAKNPLWKLASQGAPGAKMPQAWALMLGGATLLGASRSVRSSDESFLRVHNPRLATWWLLGIFGLIWWAGGAGAASTMALASAVFGFKVWRVRRDCPHWLRAPRIVRVAALILLAGVPLLCNGPTRAMWGAQTALVWREWHQVGAWLGVSAAILALHGSFRAPLREAVAPRFFDRALLQGALAGFGAASVLIGPGAAVFWAFWPLCGLFFDLLAAREPSESSLAAELRTCELAPVEPAP